VPRTRVLKKGVGSVTLVKSQRGVKSLSHLFKGELRWGTPALHGGTASLFFLHVLLKGGEAKQKKDSVPRSLYFKMETVIPASSYSQKGKKKF